MISHTSIFSAFIAGEPKGQPRPRAFSRGGAAAVYDPSTAEGWKSSVAMAFKSLEGASIGGPLMVALTFYFPRPKGHFGKRGLLPSAPFRLFTKKPDADNAAKAVLDALTILRVWRDDDQVTDLIVRKRWAHPKPPGCKIEIHQLYETRS